MREVLEFYSRGSTRAAFAAASIGPTTCVNGGASSKPFDALRPPIVACRFVGRRCLRFEP